MHDQFTMPVRAMDPARPPLAPEGLTLAAGDALLSAFLAGRSPLTLRAYQRDLEDFRRYTDLATVAQAAALLLTQGHGAANGLALAYRADLVARGLAPASINRRLAAVRSLVKVARTLGLVPWALEVANVTSQGYRDTRGPGDEGYRRLLAALDRRRGPAAHRDRAAVRLLFDLALRRGEVVSLDLAHLDLAADVPGRPGVVHVLGKGQTERVPLTLPEPTRAALAGWLAVRGPTPGPLFVNFDRARKGLGRRLTGRSLHRIVRALGQEAGLKEVRPHGLRHAAITAALDRTGGDIRAVQRFSRHRDVRVLTVYDDNREDLGGHVARLVASPPGFSDQHGKEGI